MRYFITEIRKQTEAQLQERKRTRDLVVKYGLVLVKLVWLIQCWGTGAESVALCLTRLLFSWYAASQDEWTQMCRSWCCISLLHYCTCMFTSSRNFLSVEGVLRSVLGTSFWPVYLAFRTHLCFYPFDCVQGLKSHSSMYSAKSLRLKKYCFFHSYS